MRTLIAKQELRSKAVDALIAVLAHSSAVKVQEIMHDLPAAEAADGFRACVEIYGRPHTLACQIMPDTQPTRLRAALETLRNCIACSDANLTSVIIAPRTTAVAQAICNENCVGCLDLEGNARLWVGEVFILKRTMPLAVRRSVVEDRPSPATIHAVHRTAA